MTEDAVQRDLGRMEAQITMLISHMAVLNAKVDAIDRTLTEARGGWRMLMLIGGVAGTIGGLIGAWFPFLGMRAGG